LTWARPEEQLDLSHHTFKQENTQTRKKISKPNQNKTQKGEQKT